jgi:thiol-disulfide isomerase/thioredoxin
MASRVSKKTWLIWVILIIAVVALVGIALSCSSSNPSDSTPQSQNATDFTLPTLTGANITLSELEGTPVVLNFWSISCSWCRKQLPYLENVAQQSEGEIKVIAVNVGESAAKVQEFFGDYEPTMIVALDENIETFVTYCQNYDNLRGSIPFTLFVDSEGVIQYKRIGAFTSEAELWNTLHDVFGITIP